MRLLREGFTTIPQICARLGLRESSVRKLYGARLHCVGKIGPTNVYRSLEVDQIAQERAANPRCRKGVA